MEYNLYHNNIINKNYLIPNNDKKINEQIQKNDFIKNIYPNLDNDEEIENIKSNNADNYINKKIETCENMQNISSNLNKETKIYEYNNKIEENNNQNKERLLNLIDIIIELYLYEKNVSISIKNLYSGFNLIPFSIK